MNYSKSESNYAQQCESGKKRSRTKYEISSENIIVNNDYKRRNIGGIYLKKKEEKKPDEINDTKKDDKKKKNEENLKYNIFSMLFDPIILPQDNGGPKDTLSEKKLVAEMNCKNPNCNHKDYDEDPSHIEVPKYDYISNIDELIELGKTYHCKKNREVNGINLRLLFNLIAPLNELNSMIGMKKVKEHMVNQILFFLQGFNKKDKCNMCTDCVLKLPCAKSKDEMLHTVITGPPGVGKTQLGKILGKVYREMGILSNDKFKLVTRADLIGEYLGHTAVKTQKVIDSCKGGVLFIDEAYSLGNKEGRDSFSKECIDTLNQNLSEKRDFLCIIAGYKDALEKCFFNYNDGLRRRFTFRYDIEKYNADELRKIFELKVRLDNWSMPYDRDEISDGKRTDEFSQVKSFFDKNYANFPNYGGDIETLFLQCKISHSRAVMSDGEHARKVLSVKNIKDGFAHYLEHRKYDDKASETKKKYDIRGIYD